MNTDFDRVRRYYSRFDEWERLSTAAGRLEFEILTRILSRRLPANQHILDLGGGPGRYAFFLAQQGHRVCLADISSELISQAQVRCATLSPQVRRNVARMDVINAIDLSTYPDDSFDAVLLFGPLYHLGPSEARVCLEQVSAKLRPEGLLFAVYMPYELGLRSTLERALFAPDQVDHLNLCQVADTGHFRNNSPSGFQEAHFPRTDDLLRLFSATGYAIENLRSIRGIAFGSEEGLLKRGETDPELYGHALDLLDKTSGLRALVDTSGHALLVATNRRGACRTAV